MFYCKLIKEGSRPKPFVLHTNWISADAETQATNFLMEVFGQENLLDKPPLHVRPVIFPRPTFTADGLSYFHKKKEYENQLAANPTAIYNASGSLTQYELRVRCPDVLNKKTEKVAGFLSHEYVHYLGLLYRTNAHLFLAMTIQTLFSIRNNMPLFFSEEEGSSNNRLIFYLGEKAAAQIDSSVALQEYLRFSADNLPEEDYRFGFQVAGLFSQCLKQGLAYSDICKTIRLLMFSDDKRINCE